MTIDRPHLRQEITSEFDPNPITKIGDDELLRCISCPGFIERFDTRSINVSPNYELIFNPSTQANLWLRSGWIQTQDGKSYNLSFLRDADNAGVCISDPDTQMLALRLVLRDRGKDGSLEATPPTFLKSIGSLTDADIPDRSRQIGCTAWYYSSPKFDTVPCGSRVEFSITSSDPDIRLVDLLNGKVDRLRVPAEQLTEFIRDPFAMLPLECPNETDLRDWYASWWQVVNRELREKKIPYPGQTSERGFTGYFSHLMRSLPPTLKEIGYTHLSGVPSWYYVWGLNKYFGFETELPQMEYHANEFFQRLDEVKLPEEISCVGRLGDTDPRNALRSWNAVAGYAIELAPNYFPELQVSNQENGIFCTALNYAREAFTVEDKIITHPLKPGVNVWQSLKL